MLIRCRILMMIIKPLRRWPQGSCPLSTHTVRSTQVAPRGAVHSPHTQYAVRRWPQGVLSTVHSPQYAVRRWPQGVRGPDTQYAVRSTQPEPKSLQMSLFTPGFLVRSTQYAAHSAQPYSRTGVLDTQLGYTVHSLPVHSVHRT